MKYTKKAISGAIVAFIMMILATAASYLTRIVLARRFSPEEYGLFYAVFAFISFIALFTDLGLTPALVKYIAQFVVRKQWNKIKTAISFTFLTQFGINGILAVVLFIFSTELATVYFKNPQAALLIKLISLYILGGVLFRITKPIFQGFQRISLFSSMEFVRNTLIFLAILVALQFEQSILAAAYGYLIMALVMVVIYLPLSLRTFSFFTHSIEKKSKMWRELIKFGVSVFAVAVASNLITYIDTIMLTGLLELSAVGIYNVVLPLALTLIFLSKGVSAVIFPMASELVTRNDSRRLAEGLQLVHRYFLFLAFPLASVLAVFSSYFITLLFGVEYVAGTVALQILTFGVILFGMAFINGNLIAGMGKPKIVTKIILLTALSNILLNLLLIPSFGVNGAALGTALSYFLMLILTTTVASRLVKIAFPFRVWIKGIVPGIVFLFILILCQRILVDQTLLAILLGTLFASLLYLFLSLRLKIINKEEVMKYLSRVFRKN